MFGSAYPSSGLCGLLTSMLVPPTSNEYFMKTFIFASMTSYTSCHAGKACASGKIETHKADISAKSTATKGPNSFSEPDAPQGHS